MSVPRTPANFTGTCRRANPDGGHAVLTYVRGHVVEVAVYDAEGVLIERVYAADPAMPTTSTHIRSAWPTAETKP